MRPPQSWRRARVTLALAAVSAAAWIVAATIGAQDAAAMWGGFIPARADGAGYAPMLAPFALTPLTATLVHAGFAHLAFNLVILLFCGRSVENIVGPLSMAVLYAAGAYGAAAAHFVFARGDAIPMIGASGAISAILGAYATLFGRNKVRVGSAALATWLNAAWLAAAWVVLQIFVGLTYEVDGNSLAIAAHIGGFLVGMALARPLLLLRYRNA